METENLKNLYRVLKYYDLVEKVAFRLGVHKNTIHNRLTKKQRKYPEETVKVALDAIRKKESEIEQEFERNLEQYRDIF